MAYTKTVWENLPSTNTPINANNLNKIEDGIEDIEEQVNDKNVITARLNTAINITSTQQYDVKKITLDASVVAGNRLTFQNGEIVIGEGVSKVLISGTIGSTGSDTSYGMEIHKNNVYQARAYNSFVGSSSYTTISVSPKMIEVAQGDIITLKIYINSTGITRTIRGNNETHLTVEVIE